MQIFKKHAGLTAILQVFGILILVAVLATTMLLQNAQVITIYLGQESYKVVDNEEDSVNSVYYKPDYDSLEELQADETVFAEQVQAEGSVLLQNKNLPLKDAKRVTLLGSASADGAFYISGGGSAAIDTTLKPPMQEVFEDAGFTVNPVMLDFYLEGAGKSTAGEGSNYVGEAPLSAYTAAEYDSWEDYNDAAIVFIGRMGQEGNDVRTSTVENPDKTMLEFGDNEMALIGAALENFDKVVVLLNTMNPMECGPLLDKNVSILWVGAGGQQGLRAIPKLLRGEYNPSGRLVDTYVYDNFSAPAMVNFGDFSFSNVNEEARKYYYNYAENIYIGYKYYETRYADKVMGTGNAGDYDYEETVIYPFGFGLSYTQFEYSDFALDAGDNALSVSVKVTNTGDTAGKEVVEIYMQSPYTDYDKQYAIEKSAAELVAFGKTDLLEPGKSEVVELSIPKEYMRVYDAYGAGTYVVDAGDYYFAVGSDSHDALNNILAAQGYGEEDGMTAAGNGELTIVYTQEKFGDETYSYGEDGEKIVNRFDDSTWKYYDDSFTYLTRSDWVGTWPEPLGGEDHSIEASAQLVEDLKPDEVPEDPNAVMPTFNADNGLTLASLIGVAYDSEYWELLLDQMAPEEMMNLVAAGGFATIPIESIGKPATAEKDGPAGVSSSLIGGAGCFGYPIPMVFSSTWNIELQRRFAWYFSNDAILTKVPGVYCPSTNMHRTPFSGRNFEYYSEDSFQSGVFAAVFVEVTNEKGLYCYAKHFAVNDQELNREAAATFATEQTIREIYLRPFEMAVRDGGARAIMTAKNRIGTTWCGGNYALLTEVLRGEWGFVGHVVTDHTTSSEEDYNGRTSVHAGLDLYHASAGTYEIPGCEKSATVMNDLRRACHNILYNVANSLVMNNISANAKVVPVMPPWEIALIAVDCVLAVGIAVGSFFIIRKMVKGKEEE